MNKKLHLIYIIFLFQLGLINSSFSKINIIALVDDEIITNYDVIKETRYLIVLNPNLNNLDNEQIYQLGKQSLIKEIIKKREVSKFVNVNEENLFADEYLKNLLIKLGYENKKTFGEDLLKNKTYSFEEIKLKIRIELYWNDLIFNKYNNQVMIDKKELLKKINNIESATKKEIFLSEIIFKKKKDENINDLISKIKKSINEIGFDNTANIFSISDSSKLGGKIGWVKEESLSKKIYEKIKNLKPNEYTEVLKLENSFLILKVDKIRTLNEEMNKDDELQKLIQIEKNKKLEKFSRIYFNKVKTNYLINEK
jgi:peptidyl-prolyl cis-trans isomerase SurA